MTTLRKHLLACVYIYLISIWSHPCFASSGKLEIEIEKHESIFEIKLNNPTNHPIEYWDNFTDTQKFPTPFGVGVTDNPYNPITFIDLGTPSSYIFTLPVKLTTLPSQSSVIVGKIPENRIMCGIDYAIRTQLNPIKKKVKYYTIMKRIYLDQNLNSYVQKEAPLMELK